MRINLVVEFKDKDIVKSLGAKWDGINKIWYIIDQEDLRPFWNWIPSHMKLPKIIPDKLHKLNLIEIDNILDDSKPKKVKKRQKKKKKPNLNVL